MSFRAVPADCNKFTCSKVKTLSSVSELRNQSCASLRKRQCDLANIYKDDTRVT